MGIIEKIKKNYFIIYSVIVILSLLITVTTILYFSIGFTCERYHHMHWDSRFRVYFKANDMNLKVANLKEGLDDLSAGYIDQFMKNSKCWDKCINLCLQCGDINNLWSPYDKKLFQEFKTMQTPELYEKAHFNSFKYLNAYGMRGLPQEFFDKIDGKDVLDLGAWPGDTAYIFHKLFPHSNIFAYEPLEESLNEMNEFFEKMKEEEPGLNLIHSINKGVGMGEYKTKIVYHDRTNLVDMVSLDYDYPRIKKNSLGLIKIDVESYESDVIQGAENIIKKYKPVLLIVIVHTPQDFFEMKDKLKALNPDYKFMIRRSDIDTIDGDLVLIAY